MPTHKWADIQARAMSPAEIAESKRRARAELLSLNLKELREAAGMTQVELAALAEVSQPRLSRLESEEDPNRQLSTIRRYVQALGGEVEVVAVLGNKRVTLVGV
jgi:DNA-binding XRE family transcriptional regulator